MKIGIVTTWFERGAAYVSKELEKVFISQGYDVYIFARGGEMYARKDPKWNSKNVLWSYPGIFNFSGTPIKKNQFKKWIKKNNIDTIIFNEQQSWEPVIWAKEFGCKTGSYIDYYKEDSISFFNIYDFLICNTKRHLSAFESHPNSIYIPWGTDTKLFTKENSLKLIDSNFKVKKDSSKINFFCSAGMNPSRKGVDTLINCIYEIKNDNIKTFIHCQKDIKKVFPHLIDKIKTLENNGCLTLINGTFSAPGLYFLGDFYIYLSKLDGIGLSLPEAISCGLIPVTPDHPPMNEFAKKDFSFLISVSKQYSRSDAYFWPQIEINEVDLKNQILAISKLDKDYIKKLKTKARDYAERKLNWIKNSKDLPKMVKEAKINKLSNKKEYLRIIKKNKLYNLKIMDLIVFPYLNIKRYFF
mgnify:CR=1 FL=1